MELFVISSYVYCFIVSKPKTSTVHVDLPNVKTQPSISFSGCALQFTFYAGVNKYFIEQTDYTKYNVLSVSGGSFGAVPLALGLKTQDWMNDDFYTCYNYYSTRKLHLWFDSTDFIYNMWQRFLPEDAYIRCTNRLFIQISRLGIFGFYPEVVYSYASNHELICALLCSSHIPGMFTNIPTFRGKYGFDGCFTNMQPVFNDRFSPLPTIVVKLFGRGTIDYKNKLPLYKMVYLVRPQSRQRLIDEAYQMTEQWSKTKSSSV